MAKAIRDLQGAFARPSVSHHFEVVDDASTTFRSEHIFRVKAQIQTRFFLRQYYWTGSGVDEPQPELVCAYDTWGFPKHKLHGPIIVEGSSRTVLVDLGETYDVGAEDTIHFQHRLKDLERRFQPHIGHVPKPGTKEVSLSVTLPLSLAENVSLESISIDTRKVMDSERLVGVNTDGKLKFSRTIKNPKTSNTLYQIRW